jgi:hypothetical protein
MARELAFGFEDETPGEGVRRFSSTLTVFLPEGPLDLLSELARRQKSIYRRFPYLLWPSNIWPLSRRRRAMIPELAADYLGFMAAWLAFLKSEAFAA